MSKRHIAVLLYRLQKTGQMIVEDSGRLYSADELLTMYYGRPFEEAEAQEFIIHYA